MPFPFLPFFGIIGGAALAPQDWAAKSTVAIESIAGESMIGLCTGTLIDQDLVITAAHCLNPQMRIAFGVDIWSGEAITVDVDRSAGHPLYGTTNLRDGSHDIAVLHFNGGIPSGFELAAIPISLHEPKIANGDQVILAGYGISSNSDHHPGKLRMASAPILDAQYRAGEFTVDQSKGTGSCFGDSGGPVYAKNPALKDNPGNPPEIFIGVTSGGPSCDTYGIFTRVASFIPWISTVSAHFRTK